MDAVSLILACSLYANNSITKAMIANGSQGNPLVITTFRAQGPKKTAFHSVAQAAAYARTELAQNHRIEIGLMQIPGFWLPRLQSRGVTLTDLMYPCTNLKVATDILNFAAIECKHETRLNTCTLAIYKKDKKDDPEGIAYARQILAEAKTNPFVKPDLEHSPTAPSTAAAAIPVAGALPAPVFSEDGVD